MLDPRCPLYKGSGIRWFFGLPHRRSSYRIQCREAARFVSHAAVRDKALQESVNVLTPGRVAVFLQNRFGTFDLQVINSYEVSEVLSDGLGRGSLQKKEIDPFESG